MKRTVFQVALGLGVLFGAHGVLATQIVIPTLLADGTQFPVDLPANTWKVSKSSGSSLVFFGRYNSDIANESGLGLKIAYDPLKVLSVAIDPVSLQTKCMVFTPDTSVSGQVLMGWADTSQRPNGQVGWPTLADGTPNCINPAPGIVTNTSAVPTNTTLFKFTATMVSPFTSGSTTITLTSPSASSASGTAAFTTTNLVVNGGATPPISFLSASSRKTHTGVGDFDIAIDPAGSLTPASVPITVEPRTIGSGYKIVFLFDSPPTSATVTTSSGAGVVAFAGNEATVTLTGVADASRVQVGLTNVNGLGVAATATLGLLVGDVNGSRLVNSTDILTVKAASSQAASASNFKSDLNASGLINSTDILTVKASSTHTLP